jgi:hypothetical protein
MEVGVISQLTSNPVFAVKDDNKEIIHLLRRIDQKLDLVLFRLDDQKKSQSDVLAHLGSDVSSRLLERLIETYAEQVPPVSHLPGFHKK